MNEFPAGAGDEEEGEDEEEDIWCGECDGEGVVYFEGEGGEEVEEECPECAGSGWNEGEPPQLLNQGD